MEAARMGPASTEAVQRHLRQTAVGLSYHDEAVMAPVWDALSSDDYPAATVIMMDLAGQGTIALHDQAWSVLSNAADYYELDTGALDRAWRLPDKPALATGSTLDLAQALIDLVSARTGDPLASLRESFRCGEQMMAIEDLTVIIDREGLELTVAEQTALKIVLWHLSPAWFQELPLRPSRGSI